MVENIVVELKRPNVRLGSKEVLQIEEYALAVMRDERFSADFRAEGSTQPRRLVT